MHAGCFVMWFRRILLFHRCRDTLLLLPIVSTPYSVERGREWSVWSSLETMTCIPTMNNGLNCSSRHSVPHTMLSIASYPSHPLISQPTQVSIMYPFLHLTPSISALLFLLTPLAFCENSASLQTIGYYFCPLLAELLLNRGFWSAVGDIG